MQNIPFVHFADPSGKEKQNLCKQEIKKLHAREKK